jgi:hypothetical protein
VLDAYSINLIYQAEKQFLNPFPVFRFLDGDLSPAKIWRHLCTTGSTSSTRSTARRRCSGTAPAASTPISTARRSPPAAPPSSPARPAAIPCWRLLNPLFPQFLTELIRSAATTHALGQFWRVMSDLFLDLARAERDGRVDSIAAVVTFIKEGLVAAAGAPITYAVEIGGSSFWVLPPEAGLTFLGDVAVPYVEAVFLRGTPFLGTVSFNAQAQQISPDQAQFMYGALYADPLPTMGSGIPPAC